MSTTATRPRILSRALALRFVSIVACSVSFYLPLSVIPLLAGANGSSGAAGYANGALLAATVLGELITPRLVTRVGYRWALALGLVLLGAPAVALVASSSLVMITVVGLLRGLGFAITVVAGGALTAALIPDERRGEGLAIVGLVGGIPALIALPIGVWTAQHAGFDVVFVVTAVAPLLALVTLPGLPNRDAAASREHGVVGALRNPALTRPAVIFAASAAAAGVLVTYLPLAARGLTWAVPVALFAQPAAATFGRWAAGRLGDRCGQCHLLVPGSALSILGMTALAATSSAALVIAGATAFGLGFGVLQNATLSLMYARAPRSGYGAVSAIWNAAYDLGMAFGAVVVGFAVTAAGFSQAFLMTAAVMVPALALAARERTPRPTSARTVVPAVATASAAPVAA